MQKIWLYGIHSCKQALLNTKRKSFKIVTTKELHKTIQQWLKSTDNNIPIFIESVQTINDILTKNNSQKSQNKIIHQGIALLTTPLPELDIYSYLAEWKDREEKNTLILCLDQIQDTNNLGAIIRTAAAFNVGAIIIPKNSCAQVTSATAKTACGGLESVSIIKVTNMAQSLKLLKQNEFWCYALDHNSDILIKDVKKEHKYIVLVIGSEEKGIRNLVKQNCDFLVKIDINQEKMESLNASNAAAIAIHCLS